MFPIHATAGPDQRLLHYAYFSWFEEMTTCRQIIISLIAIFAVLSVSAAPFNPPAEVVASRQQLRQLSFC